MICALIVTLPSTPEFPGRNLSPVLGRPLAAYPTMVGLSSPSISKVFVYSDLSEMQELALSLGANVIGDMPEGASLQATVVRGADAIAKVLNGDGKTLDLLVVMFAHAPTITPQAIEAAIHAMRNNTEIDAAMTVSCSRHWNPQNAYQISPQGLLEPILASHRHTVFRDEIQGNSTGEGVWFADMGATLLRPGLLSQRDWSRLAIHPVRQTGGLSVDESWQIPMVEAWIKANQTDLLFGTKRTRWANYYDSERAVLSAQQLNVRSSVLDIGNDPGGLGMALRERFGVAAYCALASTESAAKEIRAMNPYARVAVFTIETLPRLDADGFDLVVALGIADSLGFLTTLLPAAFNHVIEDGALVFSIRLTTGPTINDVKASSQEVVGGRGVRATKPYVIYNVAEVIAGLRRLGPSQIHAEGYLGQPPATARTPVLSVCYAVFSVTRAIQGQSAEPRLELRLPEDYIFQ